MTLFSKIIRREIPAQIVYEDDLCLAFKDINPQAPVHILLIPKKEIAVIHDAEAEDQALLGHLFLKTAEIAKLAGIKKTGYRVVVNNGPHAQQTVAHIHLHIIGGRQMGWPPG